MWKMPKTKRFQLHLSKFKKPKSNLQAHSLLFPGCNLLKTSLCAVNRNHPTGNIVESPKYTDTPKDLHGTHRFFVGLSQSNSIADEKLHTGSGNHLVNASETLDEDGREAMRSGWNFQDPGRGRVSRKGVRLPRESIALTAYSKEPCKEFQESMMEMVVSRIERNRTVDWNYLEELVICYLELNEKCCHEHILSAFANVVVEVHQTIGQIPY